MFQKKKKVAKRLEAPPAPAPVEEEDDFGEDDVWDEPVEEPVEEAQIIEPPEEELPPMPSPSRRAAPKAVPQRRKERWSVRTVPIQSQTVIYDEAVGKAFGVEQALVRILNALEEG